MINFDSIRKYFVIIPLLAYCAPCIGDNLYYYLETLPPTISEREYTRFKSTNDVVSYVDSCTFALNTIGNPNYDNIDNYINLAIEIHDLIDQFPDCFCDQNNRKASDYTIIALEAIEKLYGIDSEKYSRLFADYLLYDCKDKITNKLAYKMAQDAFSQDSLYTSHVRYKLNRYSNINSATIATIFATRNSIEKININNELIKENIWISLLLNLNILPIDRLYDLIQANYTYINNLDEFINSIHLRQLFMDGTGLMLSFYANSISPHKKDQDFQYIKEHIKIVEKSFCKIIGEVSIHKKANLIHVLAYLQSWKKLMKATKVSTESISNLNVIIDELYKSIPLIPKSYKDALYKYNYEKESDLSYELSEYNSNDAPFLNSLIKINEKIKSNDVFSYVESLLPPIIEWRLEELHEQKEYLSLLEYCEVCLEYIEEHYDNSFMWFTDYTSDKTIEASNRRRERLIAQGWTGHEGDKYFAATKVLDYSVDYLIKSQGYHNPSAPFLLWRTAISKKNMGDITTAQLYSKIADDLFNLLNINSIEYIDNKRILATINYDLNNDSSKFEDLKQVVPKLEGILLEKYRNKNYDKNSAKIYKVLCSIYNSLTDFHLKKGELSAAEYWNNKVLDLIYSRKGSQWHTGGSVITIPNARTVSAHYRQWLISKANNNSNQLMETYNDVYHEVMMLEKFEPGADFEMFETHFKIKSENNQIWENRNDEIAINGSKYIKNNIQRYCALMHPRMRTNYLNLSQKLIIDYNGILANSDSPIASEYIFNNLILFRGLQLLNERLIANAINFDKECKKLLEKSAYISNIKQNELIGIFNSDFYVKKAEERALTTHGINDLLSVDYKSVQAQINTSDIIVEFFKVPFWNDENYNENKLNNEYGYYAAILKDSGLPQIVPLFSSEKLSFKNSQNGYNNKQLFFLAKLIWEPILPYLHNIKNIYFTPDAELHNIPIEYLPYDSNRTMSDAYSVYRLSSSRVLLNQDKDYTQNKSAALFGDMHYKTNEDKHNIHNYDLYKNTDIISEQMSSVDIALIRAIRRTIEDLPNTKVEINYINNSFKNKNIKCSVFTEYEATEEAFKSLTGNSPNIIHIATHGKYWPKIDIAKDIELKNVSFLKDIFGNSNFEDPLSRSVLFFSGANKTLTGGYFENGEDEVLTAREISALDFTNVDLIVLSACQTALGDVQEDGIFGLQRGFKKAGVKSLLMSLWKVNDAATAKLMIKFYQNLLNGMNKIESLRNAQQYVKSTPGFESPEYWAGFILLDAMN